MKAIILAAGLGTRLKPLTDHTPKPLVKVGGIPLIFYNLALLMKHNIHEVVINLHHLGDQIEKVLGDGSPWGFRFSYSLEPKILGTGGGIKKAHALLGTQGAFVVINGDILTDFPLNEVKAQHTSQKPLATLVVKEAPPDTPFGILERDASGRLLSILGHPKMCGGQRTFFTGAQILEPAALADLPAEEKTCLVRNAYIPLLEKGAHLSTFLQKDYWNDLGTLERLKTTEKELATGHIKLSYAKELKELVAF